MRPLMVNEHIAPRLLSKPFGVSSSTEITSSWMVSRRMSSENLTWGTRGFDGDQASSADVIKSVKKENPVDKWLYSEEDFSRSSGDSELKRWN